MLTKQVSALILKEYCRIAVQVCAVIFGMGHENLLDSGWVGLLDKRGEIEFLDKLALSLLLAFLRLLSLALLIFVAFGTISVESRVLADN